MTPDERHTLGRAYTAAFSDYLSTGGEEALNEAYELGRRAADEGIGILDLVSLHHDALATAFFPRQKEMVAPVTRASEFLAEAVSLLEMALQGYREANQTLQRQNRELKQLKRSIEAANKELEAFSYSVAHDLRSPLRAMDGFSQILLEEHGDQLDAQGVQHIQRIRDAARQMNKQIEGLLSLSKLSHGEVQRVSIDLSALAGSILAGLQQAEPERKVELVIAPNLKVYGDLRLLEIALDNLLRNAWKFTSKQPLARIELGTVERDGRDAYFIRDNGVGFNPAYAHRLFSVFQRLHPSSEFEGTGIGLATVARAIHRHAGTIWAEGQIGLGATFYFTLE